MTEGFMLFQQRKTVGYMVLWDGFKISTYKKPSWFYLATMRCCFGWKWEESHD